MNIRKSYITLVLIAVFAVPPIDAQSARQRARDTAQKTAAAVSKSETVERLNNAYKSLMKHLQCAVKGNCSAEEWRNIKKTALWIAGALAVFYIGKRIWQRKGPTSLRVRHARIRIKAKPPHAPPKTTIEDVFAQTRSRYEATRTSLDKLLEARPDVDIANDPHFKRTLQKTDQQVQSGAYFNALRDIHSASTRAQELIKKKGTPTQP